MKKQTIGFAALAMLQKILSLSCFLVAAGTLEMCIRDSPYTELKITIKKERSFAFNALLKNLWC